MIERKSLLPHQPVEPPVAEPPPLACKLAKAFADGIVRRSRTAIPHRTAIGVQDKTRPALADLMG
jgi:hypothetical protein